MNGDLLTSTGGGINAALILEALAGTYRGPLEMGRAGRIRIAKNDDALPPMNGPLLLDLPKGSQGVIREIFIAAAGVTSPADFWNGLQVSVYPDIEKEPAIGGIFAGALTGCWYPLHDNPAYGPVWHSKYVSVTGNNTDNGTYGFSIKLPMPFHNGCQVSIVDGGSLTNCYGTVIYDDELPASPWRNYQLRASFDLGNTAETGNPPIEPGHSKTFLERPAGSRGVVALVSQAFDPASANNIYLEGNHRFYIDGEETPSCEYSGCEDYGQGSYYWHASENPARPVPLIGDGGGLVAGDFTNHKYRFLRIHETDPIAYTDGIKAEWGNDWLQNGVNVTLSSCCLYYEHI
jgi:hypothetical protein